MTIKQIHFVEAVQIPGRISVITTWNVTEHAKLLKAEETQHGVRLTLVNGDGQPTDIVDVYRSNVKQIIRSVASAAPGKEQKK